MASIFHSKLGDFYGNIFVLPEGSSTSVATIPVKVNLDRKSNLYEILSKVSFVGWRRLPFHMKDWQLKAKPGLSLSLDSLLGGHLLLVFGSIQFSTRQTYERKLDMAVLTDTDTHYQ